METDFAKYVEYAGSPGHHGNEDDDAGRRARRRAPGTPERRPLAGGGEGLVWEVE